MPGQLKAFDWDALRAEQDGLFDWLRNLGFEAHDRLRKHGDNLRAMVDGRLGGSVSAEKGHEALWSIGESLEFVEACRVIKANEPKGYRDVLKRALDGPIDPSREAGAGNRGRNAMFELVVGAHLAAAGFDVEFRENPDVHAEPQGTRFRVECKRPQSLSSVEKLLYEGAKQLAKTGSDSAPDFGIVAISATRLLNSKTTEKVESFQNVDEMYAAHHDALHGFIDRLAPALQQIKRHKVSAVLVHSAFPARVSAEERQFTFQERMMLATAALGADREQCLRGLFA